jgi:uncharacterized protein
LRHLIAILLLAIPSLAQNNAAPAGSPSNMQPYFMVFLVKGPNRAQPEAEAQELQRRHLAYISQQHQAGKYMLAGPFTDDGHIRGIIIVKAATLDDARALVTQDPAVKAGRMNIEIHPAIFTDLSCLGPKKQ